MSAGKSYNGGAGNTTSQNGGTFVQSTTGVSGSYLSGSISATIGTFGSAGTEQIGSVQILVNGSIEFALPVDIIDPGSNGIVSVSGDNTKFSVGANLFGPSSNLSLEGKTVSGRVSVNGPGPTAIVSFSLSNPRSPAPGGGILGPLGVTGLIFPEAGDLGLVGPDGSPLSGAGPLSPSDAPLSLDGQPAYVGDYPTNPPQFPPDQLDWPNASFTFSDQYGAGGTADRRADRILRRNGLPQMSCLKPKGSIYLNIAGLTLPANFPQMVQLRSSNSAQWLKISPGFYNANGAAGSIGIRVYKADAGVSQSGAWVPSAGLTNLRPEWVGQGSYPDLIPWGGDLMTLVVELTGVSNIPAASAFELVIQGFDT